MTIRQIFFWGGGRVGSNHQVEVIFVHFGAKCANGTVANKWRGGAKAVTETVLSSKFDVFAMGCWPKL